MPQKPAFLDGVLNSGKGRVTYKSQDQRWFWTYIANSKQVSHIYAYT